jgi:hypothetical protein
MTVTTTKVWRWFPAKMDPLLEEKIIQKDTRAAKVAKSSPLTCQPDRIISDIAVSFSLRLFCPLENPRL